MMKMERCCHCGDYQVLHFRRGPATGHGPYGPRAWILASRVEMAADPEAGSPAPVE